MSREVMQMALKALESSRVFVTTREKTKHPEGTDWYDAAITALRKALAQPEQDVDHWIKQYTEARQAELDLMRELASLKTEQKPAAWRHPKFAIVSLQPWSLNLVPLYTSPPPRQPLTDEEIWQMVNDCVIGGDLHVIKYGRAIEAAHGIKEHL